MQVVPCLAMYDTMKYIQSDVGTVAFGGAMGMSGFLLAMGTKASTQLPSSAELEPSAAEHVTSATLRYIPTS